MRQEELGVGALEHHDREVGIGDQGLAGLQQRDEHLACHDVARRCVDGQPGDPAFAVFFDDPHGEASVADVDDDLAPRLAIGEVLHGAGAVGEVIGRVDQWVDGARGREVENGAHLAAEGLGVASE